ncbi:DUF1415 domain-containing protein [Rhodoferax sp.]|jgi:hypothetical protein|uniref:DUF1415 domain-containing protein n=1 Tax=Rhodoferax sp. TaxID=50421 RepID=UPI0037836798
MDISATTAAPADAAVLAATVRWLERAVIGLNLCPFAKAVHNKKQIHYAIARSHTAPELLDELRKEISGLVEAQALVRDTTLWILPLQYPDFMEFNAFFGQAERLLARLGQVGVLQIATFHPEFQFASTEPDDITNCTNRAPYPMLHLLREDSMDRAVAAYPQAEAIYQKNMETLQALGAAGWVALGVGLTEEPPQ